MRALSLFSGVGGLCSLGLGAAGLQVVGLCEIDAKARSVLRRHHPNTPIHDDVTTWKATDAGLGRVDLVAGGSPCQDLSVAGRRGGLDGERSGLFWHQCRIADDLAAPWVLWENVAGAFSSNGGADFAAVLWGLTGTLPDVPDGGWRSCGVVVGPKRSAVWRLLDAQWFGVAQRRRRVFVVAGPRGECGPEILALAEGVSGHPRPSRTPRQGVAALTSNGVETCGADDNQAQAGHLIPTTFDHKAGTAQGVVDRPDDPTRTLDRSKSLAVAFSENQRGEVIEHDIAYSLKTGGGKPGQGYPAVAVSSATGAGWWNEDEHAVAPLRAGIGGEPQHVVHPAVAFSAKDHGADATEEPSPTLRAGGFDTSHMNGGVMPAVAFAVRGRGGHPEVELGEPEVYNSLRAGDGGSSRQNGLLTPDLAVRRLTPRECERLMGWPDDHTRWAADGTEIADSHRYRMCGNGVVAPVAEWIGRRLLAVAT